MSCESEAYGQGHGHGHSHSHSHGHDHNDQGGHSHGHSHGAPPIPTSSSQSLYAHILTNEISACNIENPSEELKEICKDSAHRNSIKPCFKSDADCQVILKIPFEGAVKLYSVILRTSKLDDGCPKSIKFYNTTKDLDFDSIGDVEPTYSCEHPQCGIDDSAPMAGDELVDDSTFVEHYLPRHSFAGVTQLAIFFESNWSDDEDEPIRIYSVELRGEFQGLRKNPVVTIYESAANPADHKNLTAAEYEMMGAKAEAGKDM